MTDPDPGLPAPGPLPEDETVWRGKRETGLVGRPTARASWAYRVALLAFRGLLNVVFSFKLEVQGREHLPCDPSGRVVGGWIAAGLPHRTWIDPFAVALALPLEPRLVFFGDASGFARSAG